MYPVTVPARRGAALPRPARGGGLRAHGFSLVEALVALAVLGILVAVGMPQMRSWVDNSRAVAAPEFYTEGLRLARLQAINHNAVTRLRLSENTISGQWDWQVDLCFPTAAVPCNAESGDWSTAATPAGGDPEGASGFRSVLRSAEDLPDSGKMTVALAPAGATDVYFTQLGWVDTNIPDRLTQISLRPTQANAFPSTTLMIRLSGMPTRCDPQFPVNDPRGCAP